jgi:hypothetical protein
MNWTARRVFWKRLFVSISGILALLGIVYLWREPVFESRKRLYVCVNCGFMWQRDSTTIFGFSTQYEKTHIKPSPLARALESAGVVCSHGTTAITEDDLTSGRITRPFLRRWHRRLFPFSNELNQLTPILLQTAKTNAFLAQRSLGYALSLDPADLTLSNFLARQDFVGLVNFVQSTKFSGSLEK